MHKKKNPPLFGQSIPQDCAYCYHNGGSVEEPVCTLRLPGPGGDCRSYLYDPLLREPRSTPPLRTNFDPEEFKL